MYNKIQKSCGIDAALGQHVLEANWAVSRRCSMAIKAKAAQDRWQGLIHQLGKGRCTSHCCGDYTENHALYFAAPEFNLPAIQHSTKYD